MTRRCQSTGSNPSSSSIRAGSRARARWRLSVGRGHRPSSHQVGRDPHPRLGVLRAGQGVQDDRRDRGEVHPQRLAVRPRQLDRLRRLAEGSSRAAPSPRSVPLQGVDLELPGQRRDRPLVRSPRGTACGARASGSPSGCPRPCLFPGANRWPMPLPGANFPSGVCVRPLPPTLLPGGSNNVSWSSIAPSLSDSILAAPAAPAWRSPRARDRARRHARRTDDRGLCGPLSSIPGGEPPGRDGRTKSTTAAATRETEAAVTPAGGGPDPDRSPPPAAARTPACGSLGRFLLARDSARRCRRRRRRPVHRPDRLEVQVGGGAPPPRSSPGRGRGITGRG